MDKITQLKNNVVRDLNDAINYMESSLIEVPSKDGKSTKLEFESEEKRKEIIDIFESHRRNLETITENFNMRFNNKI